MKPLLELKLVGLFIFAGLPSLFAFLILSEANLCWLIVGIAMAAAPDCIGRCLCLVAPIPNRLGITLSIVFQAFAFFAVAGFGYTGEVIDVGVGILVGASLQLISAVFFIRCLHAAGDALQCSDVSNGANRLTRHLAQSLMGTSGLGLAAFIAAGVVLVATVVTCGFGFYLAAPIAAVLLVPFALATIGIVIAMYWAYGSTMAQLRTAILASSDSVSP